MNGDISDNDATKATEADDTLMFGFIVCWWTGRGVLDAIGRSRFSVCKQIRSTVNTNIFTIQQSYDKYICINNKHFQEHTIT